MAALVECHYTKLRRLLLESFENFLNISKRNITDMNLLRSKNKDFCTQQEYDQMCVNFAVSFVVIKRLKDPNYRIYDVVNKIRYIAIDPIVYNSMSTSSVHEANKMIKNSVKLLQKHVDYILSIM